MLPRIAVAGAVRLPSRSGHGAPVLRRMLNASSAQAIVPGVAAAWATKAAGFALADVLGRQLMSLQGVEMAASPISGIPVAIILGLAVNNLALQNADPALTKQLAPGLTFSTKALLQLGIVCVGTKLSLVDLFTAGAAGIPVVAASVVRTACLPARGLTRADCRLFAHPAFGQRARVGAQDDGAHHRGDVDLRRDCHHRRGARDWR